MKKQPFKKGATRTTTAYGRPRPSYNQGERVQVQFGTDTRTKQSFKDECDINIILARFQKTGAITHLQNNQAQYGFATSETFHESMNIVTEAQRLFAELPSTIRAKMNNDPAQFLDFVQNPDNRDELIELGLANEGVPQPLPTREVALDEPTVAKLAPEPDKTASTEPEVV